jgi:hypothetical protein
MSANKDEKELYFVSYLEAIMANSIPITSSYNLVYLGHQQRYVPEEPIEISSHRQDQFYLQIQPERHQQGQEPATHPQGQQ